MDLSQCDLVVLSGCETYLGESRRGHGLASLQAALHEAGARTVLASRWQVPDDKTTRLMLAFYQHLWAGKSKAEALRLAKEAIRQPMLGSADVRMWHWAGWILTGDPK